MPRGKKPDGLEMNNLQLKPGETSPRSPLTPTIKLSRPPSSSIERKSSLSYTFVNPNEEADLVNGGFIMNDKVANNHQPHQNGNGTADVIRGTSSAPPSNGHSPVESWNSAPSPVSSHTNGDVPNNHNHNHKNKNGAYSISKCLMPPKKSSKTKRHSLPLPGFVESGSLKSSDEETEAPQKSTMSNGGSTHSVNLLPNNVPSPTKSSASPWKRWFKRKPSNGSEQSSFSDASWMSSAEFDDAEKKPKLWRLARTITKRVSKLKNNEVAPMSQNSSLAPPEATTPAEDNSLKPTSVRRRLDSFAPSSIGDVADEIHFQTSKFGLISRCWDRVKTLRFPEYFDPLGGIWLVWLSVVTMTFLYNAIVIFLRGAFMTEYQNSNNLWYWVTADYLCDLIYILDMLVFRARLMFFQAGQGITDKRCMLTHYTSSRLFKFDLISLLPLDLFYFSLNRVEPLLRLPRLFKFHSYLEFSQKFENKSKSAHGIRIFRMVCYLLYMIHLNTCLYYAMLYWEGIRTDDIARDNEYWVYLDPLVDVYTKCLFRSAKTLIVIGNLPPPNTNSQIIFMNIDFIVGVFVFASMIGQMRDISAKAGATKDQFRRQMDDTMSLLQVWKIPEAVQKRVRMYYIYSWDQGAVLDERDLLLGVPIRMQTDIAINVHMDTLSRVSLFQDCDKMLLRDLVLKLRPLVYLPHEYICRKGAVGKEMYIIVDGSVQVLGGEKNSKVLATLKPGSVFGEISLLSVGVGNRRTADVAAPGFANLFVLDKKDLQEVVVNYPDAQESLKRKAREILKQNQASDSKSKKRRGKSLIAESILTRDPETTPTFFNAVLQIARNKRITATILKGSFNMKDDEEDDARFAFYSSSDISTDEEGQIPIKKRKRPRFLKKKGLVKDALKLGSPGGGGASSSMDGHSDSDFPEPMSVTVHPVPKDRSTITTNNPTLPNQISDAFPLSLPYLDHALPSPGLSSSMVTDNDPLEDDQDAQDSGVDVPLDGSAGAMSSFDYPDGLALDPSKRHEDEMRSERPEVAPIRSEPKIEAAHEEQEKQEDSESTTVEQDEIERIDAGKEDGSSPSRQESRPTTPTPSKTTPSEEPYAPLRHQPSPAAPAGAAPLQQPWMQNPPQIPKVQLERRATPAAEPTGSPITHGTKKTRDEVCRVKIEHSSSEKDDDDEEEMKRRVSWDGGKDARKEEDVEGNEMGTKDEVIDIDEEEKKSDDQKEGQLPTCEDEGSSVDPPQENRAVSAPAKKTAKRSSGESSQKAFKPNVQYNPRSIYATSARTDRPRSKSGKVKKHSHGDKQKKE